MNLSDVELDLDRLYESSKQHGCDLKIVVFWDPVKERVHVAHDMSIMSSEIAKRICEYVKGVAEARMMESHWTSTMYPEDDES